MDRADLKEGPGVLVFLVVVGLGLEGLADAVDGVAAALLGEGGEGGIVDVRQLPLAHQRRAYLLR